MNKLFAGMIALSAIFAPGNAAETGGSAPRLPFGFVENRGQADPGARYIGMGTAVKAWFEADTVVFLRNDADLRLSFSGGRAHPEIEASDFSGARINYFQGTDAARWLEDLPMYQTITYRGVWPGVDVRFIAAGDGPKAEYVLAPGASPSDIRLSFDGEAFIRSDGSLAVRGRTGEFRESSPVIFQEENGERVPVTGGYRVYGDGNVGFEVEHYDRSRRLVIDPYILFSGYFGDSSQTEITSVAVNSFYQVVVAGWTQSTNLPASGGYRTTNGGGVDAFVAEFSPTGGQLIYCTYLGGSGDDRALGLTVDSSNNTYVTGYTSSSNFPTLNPIQARLSGARDAFVVKLNAAGNGLAFSTYLGGSGVDTGNAIYLDSSNAPVIVGDTTSANLPVTPGAFQPHIGGGQDVFIAKLAPAGNSLASMTYYGGSGTEHATCVRLDLTNAIVFGGSTYSTNLPLMNAFQPHSGGGQDAFFAKLSSDSKTLLISSYYGGSGGSPGAPEQINGVALRPGGTIVVAGTTSSVDFPLSAKPLQASYGGGNSDGFLGRFDPVTGAVQQSTYFGGSSDDGINAIVLDPFGDVYFAGYTSSTDFPVANPLPGTSNSAMDAFIAKTNWGKFAYVTYLGGSGNDSANAIAVDSMTSIVVAGTTGSANFPVVGSLEPWPSATISSFVTKIAPRFTPVVVSTPDFLVDGWHDTGLTGATVNLSVGNFGIAGDIPVAGDWDGSGVKRIGVFRSGTWLLDMNNDGVFDSGDKTVSFGQSGDLPILGDWDGTGKIKLGLFRQGTFILDLSGHLSGVATGLSDASFAFGLATDLPVASDWNQSGTTKVGVFRSGSWLVDYNGDHVFNSLDKTYTFGQAGDLPVIGDWAGDGIPKLGVYRAGVWILDYYGTNTLVSDLTFGFGGAGYVPLVM